jgi:hypothetical protein
VNISPAYPLLLNAVYPVLHHQRNEVHKVQSLTLSDINPFQTQQLLQGWQA